ncbi:hypothetical protein FHG66_08240 [Rubellimicrobium rubrum]|uniref:Uncharacterized protein n=1 Tax=Rubellimicrobium rubrum TaxID=2585369 RepID=A0A5C4MWN5_9RHOB|nr:hypothetical protein [Rubellimicrobium rubrum]TNC50476.1 hypothetical protein FHG66_08240 [Rubellimicrobium rubrum]
MQLEGHRVLRKGHTRRRYGKVDAQVTTRLNDDGSEIVFESSIPVSKGWSDVCFVLPVDALPELMRLALERRQNSES